MIQIFEEDTDNQLITIIDIHTALADISATVFDFLKLAKERERTTKLNK